MLPCTVLVYLLHSGEEGKPVQWSKIHLTMMRMMEDESDQQPPACELESRFFTRG